VSQSPWHKANGRSLVSFTAGSDADTQKSVKLSTDSPHEHPGTDSKLFRWKQTSPSWQSISVSQSPKQRSNGKFKLSDTQGRSEGGCVACPLGRPVGFIVGFPTGGLVGGLVGNRVGRLVGDWVGGAAS